MSEPLRLPYRPGWRAPQTTDLLAKVTRDRHLVLELPKGSRKEKIAALVARIRREAPEHYLVFESGFSWVTIKEVVTRAEVLEIEDYLVKVARNFRRRATRLMRLMAARHQAPLEDLFDRRYELQSPSAAWTLHVHGFHCGFRHRETGQMMEIDLSYGTEFGVLDPMFFHNYLRTSPGLWVPAALREPYHDTARAMEILEERGRLVRVMSLGGYVEGLAAR
ncbi:hypothetical protein [Luteolibacter sp. LG18]|uniref:DUF6896 domain-containing protein n=1 Tax=Luteolibacter sp. LG18 TaxID=2819286 RepID=UPI002B31A2BE|nr:hypothetical protein llg_40210 [Luteolibacter sp. LG18]